MKSQQEWPVIYTVVVVLAAAAFMFSVRTVLSPVIAYLILLLLISPWAGTRFHMLTVLAASFLVSVWLLKTLGALLAPFILAFVLAYVLDPLVDRLQRRGMKRGWAVAALMVPAFGAFILLLVFGIPALAQQTNTVIEQLPAALQRGVDWLQNLRNRVLAGQIPMLRGEAFARALDSFSPERVTEFVNQQQAAIVSRVWGGVLGVGRGVSIVLTILGYVVLTPVLTIYLLVDFDRLVERARTLIPRNKRDIWLPFMAEFDFLLSRYLRGQMMAALIAGVLTWLGLMLLGFPYSGLVGATAGIFNLIPYLGLVVSLIPAVIISLLSGSVLASLLKVGIVFAVVQTLDGTIIGPRVVGGSVGLHPVWVILALAVGSFFFGFVGLLLAMPAAVFIKLISREALARYRHSHVYDGDLKPDDTTAAG